MSLAGLVLVVDDDTWWEFIAPSSSCIICVLLLKHDELTSNTLNPSCLATTCTADVLPQPNGPDNRIAFL